ncbi:RluA family pseudouridine synthase [Fervidibacillus albus]|uniref:Pseudouridine synthase n=1 Tax=Fervidibacillus albus TaxID=2980026 RepID=A0A9E8LSF9_9BACI|nr:RluA family pseudouridine synthase [Fervidibacillus albus]WAA08757.1 RluA family pseudouridine synthase [Fervidibacillus albus]
MQEKHQTKFTQINIQKPWDGKTIEELITKNWRVPKKLVHQLRMEKSIRVNSEVANFSKRLAFGDRLSLPILEERDEHRRKYPLRIDVLYEDDHLLIVNKPAGIKTHPNHPEEYDTLVNAIAYTLGNRRDDSISPIHRLDQDTTGIVLFAKHIYMKTMLDRMLEERNIRRTYVAYVQGKGKGGTIEANIGRDRHHPTRRRVSSTGKRAVTHYSVIRYHSQKNITEIRCHLDTGRTHQIRVHLAHIGHPLVGDRLYGGKSMFHRQALHANRIVFIHPFTLEKIDIQAPFLDDMDQLFI